MNQLTECYSGPPGKKGFSNCEVGTEGEMSHEPKIEHEVKGNRAPKSIVQSCLLKKMNGTLTPGTTSIQNSPFSLPIDFLHNRHFNLS